jgi:hypothetical protein
MALMNRPMYEHFAARHLAVKGPGAMTSIEEGVMGVLPLDLSSDPMYWNIQGIKIFSLDHKEVAGGAGTYSKMGVSLESTAAEVLIRILGVHVALPDTATGDIAIIRCARTEFSSDPGLYATGTDTRIAAGEPSQGILLNAADASIPGSALGRRIIGRHENLVDGMPLIVSAGQCIYFASSTTNVDLHLSICWVEMPAYKAER